MAIPAMAKAAGSILASESGEGEGGILDGAAPDIAETFASLRTNPKGVFSDKRLKTGMTIGRYAKTGKDSKGRETVSLGAFGSDMRPARPREKAGE